MLNYWKPMLDINLYLIFKNQNAAPIFSLSLCFFQGDQQQQQQQLSAHTVSKFRWRSSEIDQIPVALNLNWRNHASPEQCHEFFSAYKGDQSDESLLLVFFSSRNIKSEREKQERIYKSTIVHFSQLLLSLSCRSRIHMYLVVLSVLHAHTENIRSFTQAHTNTQNMCCRACMWHYSNDVPTTNQTNDCCFIFSLCIAKENKNIHRVFIVSIYIYYIPMLVAYTILIGSRSHTHAASIFKKKQTHRQTQIHT